MLELGAGIGALILDAPAELKGREIEISPAGGGPGSLRTHSLIRERRTGDGTGYAAVYPGLAEGVYTIWRDAEAPAATVTIDGGRVTSYRWPAAVTRHSRLGRSGAGDVVCGAAGDLAGAGAGRSTWRQRSGLAAGAEVVTIARSSSGFWRA